MKHRILGRQGLDVSALGLGTMGMTMAYGPSDDDESVATSRTAYDVSAADVDLTPADLERVREILPRGAFGRRHPAAMMPRR